MTANATNTTEATWQERGQRRDDAGTVGEALSAPRGTHLWKRVRLADDDALRRVFAIHDDNQTAKPRFDGFSSFTRHGFTFKLTELTRGRGHVDERRVSTR